MATIVAILADVMADLLADMLAGLSAQYPGKGYGLRIGGEAARPNAMRRSQGFFKSHGICLSVPPGEAHCLRHRRGGKTAGTLGLMAMPVLADPPQTRRWDAEERLCWRGWQQ